MWVMVGRTHLQDATPLTLGQLISGWVAQLDQALDGIRPALHGIYALAIGGTAVGTGFNADPRFGEVAARRIAEETGQPSVSAPNKFATLSAHDGMVGVSGPLRTLERKAVNGLLEVVITVEGFRGLSAAGSTPTDFNFDREMVRVEDELAHPALQR